MPLASISQSVIKIHLLHTEFYSFVAVDEFLSRIHDRKVVYRILRHESFRPNGCETERHDETSPFECLTPSQWREALAFDDGRNLESKQVENRWHDVD